MKAIDVTQQCSPEQHSELMTATVGYSPGKNGYHNGCDIDDEIDINETEDAVIIGTNRTKNIASQENYRLTNGSAAFRSEQKKNLVASLGGSNEFPVLNGNSGSKYETSRVITRLTDERTVLTNGISNFLTNGEISKLTEVRLQNGDCKTVSIPDELKRPSSLALVNESGNKLVAARKPDEEEIVPNGATIGVSSGVTADSKYEQAARNTNKDEHSLADSKKHEVSEQDSATAQWDRAVAGVKEQAFAKLQEELKKAHQELRLRDEEVTRLSRIREEVEAELEELTASLFQEAHNMVREANVRQSLAEKALKESQMQVDVLTAEVSALKTLVLTSTPSRPNPHLHPQIDLRGNHSKDDATVSGVGLFVKKHRRSPSHFNLKYGRENSPPESPVKDQRTSLPDPLITETKDGCEVDPVVHREFMAWKQNPKFDKSDAFITRIYNEDIDLCLNFADGELTGRVRSAVEAGNIFIEAVSDKSKIVFPKKCALLEAPRQCHYRMKLGDQEQWYCISQICRNRIIAVCDFLNYLHYIERGLVKSSVHDVYWEMVRLRKEMTLARLGLPLST